MADVKQNLSIDLLGIKPIGDAANTTVEKSFQGIEGFLKSVCMPALDEIGLLLRDKVRLWRLKNILRIPLLPDLNNQTIIAENKHGRNEPCICGSGKKI